MSQDETEQKIEDLIRERNRLNQRKNLIDDIHATGQFYANYPLIISQLNQDLLLINKSISSLIKEQHGFRSLSDDEKIRKVKQNSIKACIPNDNQE